MKIEEMKGIGEKTAKILYKKNIYTDIDLIHYIPRKYELYEVGKSDPFNGDVTCELIIINSLVFYKKIKYSDCLIFSSLIRGKDIRCLIFGQAFLRYKLKKGLRLIANGYYNYVKKYFVINNIFFDLFSTKIEVDYKIKEIANKTFNRFVMNALAKNNELIETLPIKYCQKYKLLLDNEYYYNAHFPKDKEMLRQIERRKKYEEFFWYALALEALRSKKQIAIKKSKNIKEDILEEIKLPYELTLDQKNAIKDIIKDLNKDYKMNRLLQGDVGSGKTIVALIAALLVIKEGYQVLFMAPTEALALQHYNTSLGLFKEFRPFLLTGQTKKSERNKLNNTNYNLIIGTHALLYECINLDNLGLVIIDEQHRFGVNQRAMLLSKGNNIDALYLTATPIPRTLGFAEFGDLDISSLHKKPKGEKNIKTMVLDFKNLKETYDVIHKEIANGHQIYVIVPFIEESTFISGIDINRAYEIFNDEFPSDRIGILHGKLKNKEKDDVLTSFKDKKIDILISTTVIEVGIDIPNASVMVILNANRFGLSQLHQLRGRIGRNNLNNYCYLISNDVNCKRLEILQNCDDGFILAEEDFKLRGPGDFLGNEQSGYLNMEFADINLDKNIWLCAKNDAKEYFLEYNKKDNKNEMVEKIIDKINEESLIIH